MRYLLPILFSIFFPELHAQYQPISVPGRQWNEQLVRQFSQGKWMNYFQIGDSLTLHGRSLPTVLKVGYFGNVEDTLLLIKEDTSSKIITFINYDWKDWQQLYGDSLILNLGLNLGDSAAYFCQWDTVHYILDSISLTFDNQLVTRRKYHFTSSYRDYYRRRYFRHYFSWTEGLGSIDWWGGSFGFFLPLPCLSDFPFLDIICVTDSDGALLHRHRDYSTCQPLGDEEYVGSKILITPNPASDYLKLQNASRLTELSILDMTGQTVRSWRFLKGESSFELSLTGLSPGIYLVHTKAEKAQSLQKIVID